MRPSRETIGERSLKHGHIIGRKKSPTYASWRNAKTRCFNPNCKKFPVYGGRGISMCGEWVANFSAFLRDMGECPPNQTLERDDVDGDYQRDNCRWLPKSKQALNKQSTVWVTVNDDRMSLATYAQLMGVNYKSMWWHINHGKSAEAAAAYLRGKIGRRLNL